MEKTHNLEVSGSSPVWPTLGNQAVNVKLAAFFMLMRKQCVNKLLEFKQFRNLSVFLKFCAINGHM